MATDNDPRSPSTTDDDPIAVMHRSILEVAILNAVLKPSGRRVTVLDPDERRGLLEPHQGDIEAHLAALAIATDRAVVMATTERPAEVDEGNDPIVFSTEF